MSDWQPFKNYILQKNHLIVCFFSFDNMLNINLQQHLSSDELIKANSISLDEVRNRFVITRGYLRYLLSQQLDCSPDDLIIETQLKGKPYLSNYDFQFNISHTNNAAVIALSPNINLGVDIEAINRRINAEAIATHIFTEREQEYLKQSTNQQKTFITLWTRKEAFVKAHGDGIGSNLTKIDIVPNDKVIDDKNKLWYLNTLTSVDSYVVTLAYDFLPEKLILLKN